MLDAQQLSKSRTTGAPAPPAGRALARARSSRTVSKLCAASAGSVAPASDSALEARSQAARGLGAALLLWPLRRLLAASPRHAAFLDDASRARYFLLID